MRAQRRPTSSWSSMRAEAWNSTVAFLHVQVALQLVHRLLVRQRQRAPVVGHRGVEVHQVVRVEDDLLHVHLGPAHAQAVEEAEVVACHGAVRKAWARALAGGGMRLPRLGDGAAHLDEFVGHAAVDLQVDRRRRRRAVCRRRRCLRRPADRIRPGRSRPAPRRRRRRRVQRREAPVVAVGQVDVLAEEVVDVRPAPAPGRGA